MLGGEGEPMAFVGEDFQLVRDVEAGEERIEGVAERHGNDGVATTVQDEGWREGGGRGGFPGRNEASGEIDDAAYGIC